MSVGFRTSVLYAIFENRDGQTRIVNVQWNEGSERVERNRHWKRAVFELKRGDGIFSGERGAFEMAETLAGFAAVAVPTYIRTVDWALDDSQQRVLAFRLYPQSSERKGQHPSFCWTIENFPVAQFSAAAERNTAGSNPAQRKGNLCCAGAGK